LRTKKPLTNQTQKTLASLSSLARTGFFHIFGSNTINQIVQFAHGILIVRVISKTEYGIYGYASNVYYFFLLLSGFGTVSAIIQLASEYSKDIAKTKSLFQFGYRFGLGFNVFLSAAILLASLLLPLPIEGSGILLGMMFLLPVFHIYKDLQVIWLRVHLKNKEFGTVNTINAVLVGAMTILGAWLFQARGIIIGHYLVAVFMILLLRNYYQVPFFRKADPLSRDDRKDLFQIAGISTLNNALSQMLSLLGTFMLGLIIADADSIAGYKVASVIPMALNFIPGSLMLYAYPYFARNKDNREWVISKYRLIMIYTGLVNLLIALFGILLAEPIVRIIFGRQYLDAVIPFRILMASYYISGTFRTIAGNLLVTQRKLKVNLVNGIIGGLSSIVLNALLIPVYGSVGAAWSYLLTMIISGIHLSVYFLNVIRRIGRNDHK